MRINETGGQMSLFALDSAYGRMSQACSPAAPHPVRISGSSFRNSSELWMGVWSFLDLRAGAGNLLGLCWEPGFPWHIGLLTAAGGASPKDAKECLLSSILTATPHPKYYLTPTACRGILRRAKKRGKELPPVLRQALEIQAAIPPGVLAKWKEMADSVAAASITQSVPIAFSCNQRDEIRDLHDLAGAVQAQPGVKQQTFIAAGVVSKGSGDCFLTTESQTAITSGGGQAGQGYPCVYAIPVNTQIGARHESLGDGTGLGIGADHDPAFTTGAAHSHAVFAAFCAGAGAKAGNIGYEQGCSPTLKGSAGGNMVPSVLCINDQGGERMDLSQNVCGALRSQTKGHPPLVLGSQQGGAEICEDLCPAITAAAGTSGNNQPVLLFENHGIDSRYTGPHNVAPTVTSRYGSGGNNTALVARDLSPETYAIAGNAVGRQPHNGGNGIGYQRDIAYSLTRTDRHCVFSQQRSDEYAENGVTSTQSARQYKDSTDLVCGDFSDAQSTYQDIIGTLCQSDGKGANNQYVGQDKCIVMRNLIRRLIPEECEVLMGFPKFWTDIPGASDSKKYRALGNSVAIPCVEYIMMGIAEVYAKKVD